MRKFIFACAIVTGFTGAASAVELGIASYYQNPHFGGLIAAHRTLPFGTQVKVINLDNGRSAVVKIVDRGPFIRGRVIDVSTLAAGVLGFRQAGLARVRLERLL
jgi:rare lipoprotein A